MTDDKINDSQTDFDYNVLVISQVKDRVVLPYKREELQERLSSGETECESLAELIEKEYTLPLSRYKHGCISRFKEAFALVREREKRSFLSAFFLAVELFFTRYLHPAIITACENSDWLDVYLDCLDRNELEEFPFFEIRYELNPPKKKKKK